MTEIFGDAIELSRDGPIATVTLNRGDGRNALSLKTMQALIDVAAALRGDTTVNVVILTGKGAFSAGADLKDATATFHYGQWSVLAETTDEGRVKLKETTEKLKG